MMDKTEQAIRSFIELEIDYMRNESQAYIANYIAKNALFNTDDKVALLMDFESDIA